MAYYFSLTFYSHLLSRREATLSLFITTPTVSPWAINKFVLSGQYLGEKNLQGFFLISLICFTPGQT